jgi:thiamine-phosphate pyrophosphorylase
MPSFRLCYITDRKGLPVQPGSESRALAGRIQEAIRAGIDLVQIREKDLATRELMALVASALGGARGTPTRVVVNDRLDVALALGASGVHLGQESLPAKLVRGLVAQNSLSAGGTPALQPKLVRGRPVEAGLVPMDFLMGVSCHSFEEARNAESAGADYVLLGPIFETPSKIAFGPPLGLDAISAVTSRLKIPVLALGGITVERVRACLDAGAAGIAGIRIFQDCDSLEARIRKLNALFKDL